MRRAVPGLVLGALVVPALWAIDTLAGNTPAGESDLDAIRAQTAGVLASVDFARQHCPAVRIDEAKLRTLITRSQWDIDRLRKDEDYDDQRTALESVRKTQGLMMVCRVLPGAHGGYARGVLGP